MEKGESSITPRQWKKILEDISTGLSINKAAKNNGTSKQSVFRYYRDDKERSDQFARAREMCFQTRADHMYDVISDKGDIYFTDEKGRKRVDSGMVSFLKNQVDFMKWEVSKMLPKIYGAQQELDSKDKMIEFLLNDLKKSTGLPSDKDRNRDD